MRSRAQQRWKKGRRSLYKCGHTGQHYHLVALHGSGHMFIDETGTWTPVDAQAWPWPHSSHTPMTLCACMPILDYRRAGMRELRISSLNEPVFKGGGYGRGKSG